MRAGNCAFAILAALTCMARLAAAADPSGDQCEAVAGSALTNIPAPPQRIIQFLIEKKIAPREDISVLELSDTGIREVRVANRPARDVRRDLLALLKTIAPEIAERYYVEPNYVVRPQQILAADEHFNDQWGLRNTGSNAAGLPGRTNADIAATRAWEISRGVSSVTIAILDSGLDYLHPDLAPNTWTAPADFSVAIDGQQIDCKQGAHGFDATRRRCGLPEDVADVEGHGTRVAGIAGARGQSTVSAGSGVAGVSWNATLLPVRIIKDNGTGTGSLADAIAGMQFLLHVNADSQLHTRIRVVSASWGYLTEAGQCYSRALHDQIARLGEAGMLFVAAAGNDREDIDAAQRFYPASFDLPDILTVTATDKEDILCANYGQLSVDIGAPGSMILSTVRLKDNPGSPYGRRSGSSMATPFASGTAALLWSHCPDATPQQVKRAIVDSVDRILGLQGTTVSGGRLNAFEALRRIEHDNPELQCVADGGDAVP